MKQRVEIFFCYARKDQALLNDLKTCLIPMLRLELINMWHDADISPGTEWEEEINKHLNTAHIVLLLVSPDFMASEYCYSKEMKRAMERHECGEVHIIPILLRSIYWQGAPFAKLQVLPTDARPVARWEDRDEALFDVAEGIRKVVEELRSSWQLKQEQTKRQEELAQDQAKRREELAREQVRQQEELAREQARQQEELAVQRVKQQRELAARQRELARERLQQREGHKVPSGWGVARVVGIDLGTTNSCIAGIGAGQPVVIPNAEGSRTTPSVVALNSKGEWLVGEAAKQQAITNPENTIFSIKRFIGRRYDDPEVVRDRRLAPYKIVRASNGDAWVEIQGKQYSPIEISARILQKLKADAEVYIGQRITQAIITVPSYFTDKQLQATRDAGKIAGLESLRIIHEPTAASLAYGLGKKRDERIAVYDMGGGTFNISVLELGDGVFEVKSTNGDTHLGGEDFTQRVIEWLADEFRKEYGIDLRQDRLALQRLKEAAEKAKKELSSSMQTEINLPFITADASGPKHLTMTLSRSKLEQLVEDLIEKSRGPVMKALSDASVRPGDINEVVLVGGQTRMPAVQAMVQRIFDREPHRGVSRDEVVAAGAAVEAGVLMGEVKDVLLLDVTPLSLGIETLGSIFTRVIERNTTIPTQKSQAFSLVPDKSNTPSALTSMWQESTLPIMNGTQVEIHVSQGSTHELSKSTRSLGHLILDDISPTSSQIEVTFDISADGTTSVSAGDINTKHRQKITVQASVNGSTNQKGHKAKLYDQLGIETLGENFIPLTNYREALPTQKRQIFKVLQPPPEQNISIVEVNVLQGEREFAKDNQSLGRVILKDIPLMPNGNSQIEVTFDIDANNIFTVRVRDKGTGQEQKNTFYPSSGLNRDQIDNMSRDAEMYAQEEKRRKEDDEERGVAESICSLAEKTIAELSDMLTPEQEDILSSRIAKVRSACITGHFDYIKSLRKELEQVFHEISEDIYNRLSQQNN